MMRIADRTIAAWTTALFQKRHYAALINMLRVCPDALDVFRRYVTNSGSYPYTIKLRTPLGIVAPTLYSYHDLLTVNEVFCRQDYSGGDFRVVLDIGANIGLSSLYFLTRNSAAKCYLYEPVPGNVDKISQNLAAFRDRYVVSQSAVSDKGGVFDFGIEPTGRYGSLARTLEGNIQVECQDINAVLEQILAWEERIDLLKLDIEGVEEAVIAAISPEYFPKIRQVVYEANISNAPKIARWSPGETARIR